MSISTLFALVLRNLEIAVRSAFGGTPRPYKLLLELTDHCNSRCKTCSIWKTDEQNPKQELSLPSLERSLADYGKHILWIALSGGEVTLYQKFPELVKLLKTYCPHLKLVTFTSNGLMPQKTLQCAQLLQQLKSDLFITLSLDGSEKIHDSLRGVPGNFTRAQVSFGLLKEAGIRVHWGLTISPLNQEFLASDDPLLGQFKAVTFVHSGGIYKQNNSISNPLLAWSLRRMIAKYQIQNLGEWVEWLYLKLSLHFVSHGRKTPIPCEVIATNLHIKADGTVLPCMFTEKIGNLEQQSLREILAQKELPERIASYRQRHCANCWMNCYGPHSMMQHPLKSLYYAFMTRHNFFGDILSLFTVKTGVRSAYDLRGKTPFIGGNRD